MERRLLTIVIKVRRNMKGNVLVIAKIGSSVCLNPGYLIFFSGFPQSAYEIS
ncbi:hypothetical protein SAMN05216550_13610 [Paraburkholderia tropica]|uniref:Uncharacterized protein n=1 Tax=Paraburkholderia tropica TaxID=92647 RepID=A0AAQ1GPB6_9BURK|nr:hypothetical protein SAMN05216550_13610 [Paraburkholderia tropica]